MFRKWEGTSWEMSPGMGNFMAGGLASNMYWLTALRESSIRSSESTLMAALDNVKNRIMGKLAVRD